MVEIGIESITNYAPLTSVTQEIPRILDTVSEIRYKDQIYILIIPVVDFEFV